MNQTATITAQYVNPPKPGKTYGSVKDSSGAYWEVDPRKVQIEQGSTINVEYSTREWQGKEYRTIQKVLSAPTPSPAPAPAAKPLPHSNGHATIYADKNERSIFITGVVGRAMGSGQFGPSDIKMLTLAAADAWEALQRGEKPKGLPVPPRNPAPAPQGEDDYGQFDPNGAPF